MSARRWFDALGVRLLLAAVLALIVLAALLAGIVRETATRPLTAVQERLVEEASEAVVARLEGMATTAEALCRALADTVAAEPLPTRSGIDRLVAVHFDHRSYDALVAGGGIWPEPGALEAGVERAAVFYSRDGAGRLAPFPGYNDATDIPYQTREWYVPVRVLAAGMCAWSRAYHDPMSQVPMVTCVCPIRRNGQLWGAATIDLRLDALVAFCAERGPAVGGYVAVLDRENRFIAAPRADVVTDPRHDDLAHLAQRDATFAPWAEHVDALNRARLTAAGSNGAALAARLLHASPELDEHQANLVSAVLATATALPRQRVELNYDPLLGQASLATVAVLAGSGWKVIAATPRAAPATAAATLASHVTVLVAVPVVLALVALFLVLHVLVVRPVTHMTTHLLAAGDRTDVRLSTRERGELADLAAAFNRRAAALEAALAEREDARAQLAAAATHLRQVLADQAELVVRCAVDGVVRYANPAWARAVGRSDEACLGDRIYADIAADDWARLRAAVEGLTPDQPQATCECRLASGGGVRWVTWSLMGTFADDGTLAAFQLVGRDATRAREAETRAERQRQQLVQADKMIALGLLTSSVAHEVSNPNQVITMNAELLARIWTDCDALIAAQMAREATILGGLPAAVVRAKTPELIANLAAAAKRIATIVGDLREFSRGGEVRCDEAVDINAVCRAAVSLLGHHLRADRCQFTLTVGEHLPLVRGHAGRLEQVLVNLLTNAVQSLAGPECPVRLTTMAIPTGVRVLVQDGGQGIPSRLLPHVSNPFVTSKGAVGGTGLGLWITTGIVRDHGGTISFDSRPGQGTTVTVELPAFPTRPA